MKLVNCEFISSNKVMHKAIFAIFIEGSNASSDNLLTRHFFNVLPRILSSFAVADEIIIEMMHGICQIATIDISIV